MASSYQRLELIDQYRGLAIVLMVLANYLAGVVWIPAWLKHAPDVGLTVIDLIAPFFIFSIGLTYGLSYRRRLAAQGQAKAAWHTTTRYLGIIGVGTILVAGEIIFGQDSSGINWGVLQAIGVAGLLTLPTILLPKWVRTVIGLALLAIFQGLLYQAGWLPIVLGSPHGGIEGSLDWAAMLILATVLADLFHDHNDKKKWFLAGSILALAAGLTLSIWSPVSKNRVSPTYILISLAVSGLLFAAFSLLVDRLHLNFPLLSAWGKNPFLLYVLHQVFLGIFVLPEITGWYATAPAWLVALQAIGLLAVLSAIACWLEKRRMVFSF